MRLAYAHHTTSPLLYAGLSAVLCACLALGLMGCGSGGEETSGPDYTIPSSVETVSYDMADATSANGASIDVSHASEGYVLAAATNSNRLKLQITSGQMSYNYDLPGDDTVCAFPLQMGDGSYNVRVMQNTSGNNYVEICQVSVDVALEDENAPFLRPNIYCNYDENSECVTLARQLVADCTTQAEIVQTIYTYITQNISYDSEKAAALQDATSYIPDPDTTLAEGSGICFDYSSLAAAMLRSLGIPTRIVTGYVSPGNIYHSWNLVYIDGTWKTANIVVEGNTWSLIDTTFGASDSSNSYVGDGTSYAERYVF